MSCPVMKKNKYSLPHMILTCSRILFLVIIVLTNSCINKEKYYTQSVEISENDTEDDIIEKAAHVIPSDRQMTWQNMEFTGFICFGVNTYSDREWGKGKEDPVIFNPTQLDTRQWCATAKSAGMKLLLLTCKHHDGFCLWPTKTTDFSVASSPWKNGNGDVVKELSEACREYDLKLGVYLSPWDMNNPHYGTEKYNDIFVEQLTELLSNYGDVAEVWFDGACGEGPNGKVQQYDFARYYKTVRQYQPDAVIAIMGPDVRWVGTESGYGRQSEWSVVPSTLKEQELIAENSQHEAGSGIFIPSGDRVQKDLGSRVKILSAKSLIWYPSEVDVSIRPGWYYHASEDEMVKSPQKLVDIYYSSVGQNSLLLLNLPPDKRGLIHKNDVESVKKMRHIIDETFSVNLLTEADVAASSSKPGHPAKYLLDQDKTTYWTTTNNTHSASIVFEFKGEKSFDRLLLSENILHGQRVEKFTLEVLTGDNWIKLAEGTTIGYKRLLRFDQSTAKKIRLTIDESRDCPEISEMGLFKSSGKENL